MKAIGSVIKSSREKLGMTREELGKKMETSEIAVEMWEDRNVPILESKTLVKLANILRISIDELCASPNYDKRQVELMNELLQDSVTTKSMGEISDGFHTFNELYHHRALLFASLCDLKPEMFWKAKKHEDGSMFPDMFIVGMRTRFGNATYHYDINPYWDMFHCEEFEHSPIFDGHTPADAIERIKKECTALRKEG